MTYQRNGTRACPHPRRFALVTAFRLMYRCLFIKFNGSPCQTVSPILRAFFLLFPHFSVPSTLLKPFAVKVVVALQTQARIKKRDTWKLWCLFLSLFSSNFLSPGRETERKRDGEPRRELGGRRRRSRAGRYVLGPIQPCCMRPLRISRTRGSTLSRRLTSALLNMSDYRGDATQGNRGRTRRKLRKFVVSHFRGALLLIDLLAMEGRRKFREG